MSHWDRLTEKKIREAIENGDFENLPGMGKPLSLEQNPYEDPEWRLALKLLKDSGFTLPWIETRREIEAELQAAQADLRRSYEWYKQQDGGTSSQNEDPDWQRAVKAFRERVQEANHQIQEYNLKTPSPRFQLAMVDADRMLEGLTMGGF